MLLPQPQILVSSASMETLPRPGLSASRALDNPGSEGMNCEAADSFIDCMGAGVCNGTRSEMRDISIHVVSTALKANLWGVLDIYIYMNIYIVYTIYIYP
jgi:hypothetical protein